MLAIAHFALCHIDNSVMAESNVGEYQAKTALIYNFAKLVQWPDSAFVADDSPFVFAFLAPDTLGSAPEIIRGKRIHGRVLEVRYYKDVKSIREGNVLFCSPDSLAKVLADAPAYRSGRHVLTVGQSGDFAERGGMVDLTFEEDRLAFIVNLVEVRRANLEINANLLDLAAKVIVD